MSAMTNLTETGNKALWALINENCTDRVREAYPVGGRLAWLNSIDDDGFLEIQGRYTKSGNPVTYRFSDSEIEA